MSDIPVKNTDVEIWRETEGDYYSPSIHVNEKGEIGIDVGGTVYVADIRRIHHALKKEIEGDES